MDKLPGVSDILLEVLEHFQMIAKDVHPDLQLGDVLSTSIDLEHRWLDVERAKAIEKFYANNGVILYSKPS